MTESLGFGILGQGFTCSKYGQQTVILNLSAYMQIALHRCYRFLSQNPAFWSGREKSCFSLWLCWFQSWGTNAGG